MLKVGIVGCGSIAQIHADAILKSENASAVAVADIIPSRADDMAKKLDCTAYYNFDDMLENTQLDVLHICTPHHIHFPMIQKAVSLGIAVFTEKPPVINQQQWEQLKRLNETVPIGICFQNRYNDSVNYVKDLLSEAGKINGIRAFVTWARDKDYYLSNDWRGKKETEGGGVLINQAIHTLDLINEFLGKPKHCEATMSNHHLKGIIEVEDTIEAYIEYEEANAIFYATTAHSKNSPVLIEIDCENILIRLEDNEVTVTSGDEKTITFFDVSVGEKAYWGNSHAACIDDFYNAVINKTTPTINIDNISNTVELMLALYDQQS